MNSFRFTDAEEDPVELTAVGSTLLLRWGYVNAGKGLFWGKWHDVTEKIWSDRWFAGKGPIPEEWQRARHWAFGRTDRP